MFISYDAYYKDVDVHLVHLFFYLVLPPSDELFLFSGALVKCLEKTENAVWEKKLCGKQLQILRGKQPTKYCVGNNY